MMAGLSTRGLGFRVDGLGRGFVRYVGDYSSRCGGWVHGIVVVVEQL